MFCPFCQAADTKVIDSRLAEDGGQVRRRRECVQCEERFTTYEVAELVLPRVVKRDGRRSEFDVQKVRDGMIKSLQKRPVGMEQVEASMQQILRKVRACGEREVSSQWIGELVMEQLRLLDPVAYVRFASIYRSFEDIQAFYEEIENLKKHR